MKKPYLCDVPHCRNLPIKSGQQQSVPVIQAFINRAIVISCKGFSEQTVKIHFCRMPLPEGGLITFE